jgi:1-deoxy-D-xylulose-5-phosphate reductoisomerase
VDSSLKRIAILGSTGSIGQSALAVVDAHPDRLQVVGLAAGENVDLLAAQMARYRPRVAAMATGEALDRLQRQGGAAGVTLAGERPMLFLGMALTETMGLFAFVVSLIILFGS